MGLLGTSYSYIGGDVKRNIYYIQAHKDTVYLNYFIRHEKNYVYTYKDIIISVINCKKTDM